MFQKVFEYAGPHKKGLYAATAVVLVSVLMGVLPFVLAYQVIAPLVMGAELDASFLILRVALVLVCLVLQAVLYGWGLNLSHKAAYDTLLRLRTALQKRFEKLPLGVIQDKGTGTVKKLFVDDVDSLEVLLAHSMPEGIANLMVPIAVYVAMFFVDWKLALLSLASIPISLIAMMTMYSVGMKKMGPYYMAGQKMNNTIIEYINGMEVVKVFNKDADSYERFRKDVSDYRDYTLAWYKAAWPWMAIYSSLLPCTVILTLPLGAWFVFAGWSALPDLILVLCLSLSIGMPLLKSLGFLPTMPQLNYKISALEQVLDAPELQQTPDSFHGKDDMLLPFCVTVMIFSEILTPFVSGGSIQWNHIWMLWGAGIVSAILVFLAAKNDYRKTYIASYKESNTTRLRIAEHLRKLPMNFFNTKDLSELTTNMMADCSSMESLLSSTIPPLIANGITVIPSMRRYEVRKFA